MAQNAYQADLAALPQMLAFVEETLEENNCPMAVSMRLCIALEEMFVNVCHYAYPDRVGDVELTIIPGTQSITFRLTDSGVPFDPLKSDELDAQEVANSAQIGGLGIHIVKQTMDQLDYRYENGQNILTMIKSW